MIPKLYSITQGIQLVLRWCLWCLIFCVRVCKGILGLFDFFLTNLYLPLDKLDFFEPQSLCDQHKAYEGLYGQRFWEECDSYPLYLVLRFLCFVRDLPGCERFALKMCGFLINCLIWLDGKGHFGLGNSINLLKRFINPHWEEYEDYYDKLRLIDEAYDSSIEMVVEVEHNQNHA